MSLSSEGEKTIIELLEKIASGIETIAIDLSYLRTELREQSNYPKTVQLSAEDAYALRHRR